MAFTPDQASDSGPTALGPRSRSITTERELDFAGRNVQIAHKLRQTADILAAQGADVFRIVAYRRAAESIRGLDTDLGTIAEKGGRAALEAIPGVGISIGSAIAEMLTTGRWAFLDPPEGDLQARNPVPVGPGDRPCARPPGLRDVTRQHTRRAGGGGS